MQEFLQQLVGGLAIGGIFASLALALVLIYNAMGLVNFAQGEMAMLATFVAYALINRGMSYWIVFPVTLVLAFGGGIVIQRIVIRPVERAPILTLVIITLGLATLLNGLAGFMFGYVPRSFPSPFSAQRSEEHTSELQSRQYLVCRLLLEKKKSNTPTVHCQREIAR